MYRVYVRDSDGSNPKPSLFAPEYQTQTEAERLAAKRSANGLIYDVVDTVTSSTVSHWRHGNQIAGVKKEEA